ncbi:MAG: M1 family metallopeptidase, partial [Deltaproteobacteria bacterium]|nr:M1 family metallopeptidase [Deltaproteobacteria bacterium]
MSPRWPLRAALALACALCAAGGAAAHPFHLQRAQLAAQDPFRQLDELLPTPSDARTAAGVPGPAYWQQRVDYDIDVRLDDARRRVEGVARIRYHNRSPHPLPYLWLQLDQRRFAHDSLYVRSKTLKGVGDLSYEDLRERLALEPTPEERAGAPARLGHQVAWVRDAAGAPLPFTVVDAMMRVDLPAPVPPGGEVRLAVAWGYDVLKVEEVWSRGGYEELKAEEGKPARRVYELAQWFPRLAAYTDYAGWQNKAFLGNGEFTLEFGDYLVRVTAPNTFTVAATGELQNPDEVLSPSQRARLAEAKAAPRPLFVITPEEAAANELVAAEGEKTWVFRAEDVRDFAFAASPTFIWDAWGYPAEGRTVMAMSLYPREAEPLWSRYSTHAIVHTLEVYGRLAFPYPYPVAISVNGPVGGMEYPMICFNGPRPEPDGTYTEGTKYGLISVVIHEVGHFFFPMIVNSDERQWTWMDEGLNSFLQVQAERAWEPDYPMWRGEPQKIVGYMSSPASEQVPIMTQSDSILRFGENAYGKPATALSVLRESVMGPALFDDAFRAYARAWRFKRPTPSDFFRAMESVSGVDLDWFWRGWFYSTLPVDVAVRRVTRQRLSDKDPEVDKRHKRDARAAAPKTLMRQRDEGRETRVDRFPELRDFYNDHDPLAVTPKERREFEEALKKRAPWQQEIHARGGVYYEVELENVGGLVTHVPLLLTFDDDSTELRAIPPEVWRKHPERVKLLLRLPRPLRAVEVDPYLETADVDRANNRFPQRIDDDSFAVGSWRDHPRENPMREAREEAARAAPAEAPPP